MLRPRANACQINGRFERDKCEYIARRTAFTMFSVCQRFDRSSTRRRIQGPREVIGFRSQVVYFTQMKFHCFRRHKFAKRFQTFKRRTRLVLRTRQIKRFDKSYMTENRVSNTVETYVKIRIKRFICFQKNRSCT